MADTQEAGRTISAATGAQLDKAMQAMKDAMNSVMQLMGLGDDTPSKESQMIDATIAERTFSQDERDKMASSGVAMDDGSYPIANLSDLHNAIQSYGRAKDQAAVKAHIIKRAKALKMTNVLPKDWQESDTPPTPSITESEFATDLVPIVESAMEKPGTANLLLINPGWGSTGYYSPAVLERDGPKVFTKGLHMYLDHPTVTEAVERPERSIKDLAAVLTSDARWDAHGPSGPGLYAEAEIDPAYRGKLKWLAPHIGVSIRGNGRVNQDGMAEGRKGPVVEELVSASSVDFVTLPGRGGQVREVFESARQSSAPTPLEESVADNAALEEARTQLAALQETINGQSATIARLQVKAIKADAEAVIEAALAPSGLPQFARKRIRESLIQNPPEKDGVLDRDAFAETVKTTVESWVTDLAESSGWGQIRGMGQTTIKDEDLTESLKAEFIAAGYSEEVAALMARG